MNDVQDMLTNGYLGAFLFILVALVIVYTYKLVHDGLTPIDDHVEMRNGNAAAALTRNGAYLGVITAMSGSLVMSDREYLEDLGMFALDGVIALVVFTLASRVFDKIMLPHVDNYKAVHEGNLAVGLVEFCSYWGLGIIMAASFSGAGADVGTGLLSAVLFCFLGLASLVVIYVGFDRVIHRERDIDQEVCNGSLATAVDVGLLMLSMSIVLAFSIAGDFTGWLDDISSYLVAAGVSILAVIIARLLSTFLLAQRYKRGSAVSVKLAANGNIAEVATTGTVTLGISILYGFLLVM